MSEAGSGFEPLYELLQSPASPLSHPAILFSRAEDGNRTRNVQLGRLILYQLSYFRLLFSSPIGGLNPCFQVENLTY